MQIINISSTVSVCLTNKQTVVSELLFIGVKLL